MSSDDFIDPCIKIQKLRNDIMQLRKQTELFVQQFADHNRDQVKLAPSEGFQLLADIICEMLPHAEIRADILERGRNSRWTAFDKSVAIWAGPLSANTQKEKIFNLPRGQVRLPHNAQTCDMSLTQAIQFIFEALSTADSDGMMALYGYRVENGDDFLIFSIDRPDGSASGAFEISMMTLCDVLMQAVAEI